MAKRKARPVALDSAPAPVIETLVLPVAPGPDGAPALDPLLELVQAEWESRQDGEPEEDWRRSTETAVHTILGALSRLRRSGLAPLNTWALELGPGARPVRALGALVGAGVRTETVDAVPREPETIMGLAEKLPPTWDGAALVFGRRILEHTRNPWDCAAQIRRVLAQLGIGMFIVRLPGEGRANVVEMWRSVFRDVGLRWMFETVVPNGGHDELHILVMHDAAAELLTAIEGNPQ